MLFKQRANPSHSDRASRTTLRKSPFAVFNPDRSRLSLSLDRTEIGVPFRRSLLLRNKVAARITVTKRDEFGLSGSNNGSALPLPLAGSSEARSEELGWGAASRRVQICGTRRRFSAIITAAIMQQNPTRPAIPIVTK
jgi:hypothetical protein